MLRNSVTSGGRFLKALVGASSQVNGFCAMAAPVFRSIPPREAKPLVDGGHTLLDVRTEGEFAERHVAGSVNVPVMTGDPHKGNAEKRPDFLDTIKAKFNPESPLVVTCGAGRRAEVAVTDLVEAGFKNVIHLEGGLKAWKNEGFS
eukprot:TRINITY_DN12026_c0_g1_i1.p1 TRINITY_DN12026_c0_g1~~TRINITY_DN12026_c0_g1_i1.p1  ORF type:complete len:146 (+),score=14.11 TRINITY_DN12026_c0_g1_i1:139-576(+)